MDLAIGSRWLRLRRGDITTFEVDAIVNAANSALAGGGGVDGAIHRAGGPTLMAELARYPDGCPTGNAVPTSGGRLPARFVFHAVGPIYRPGNARQGELLASCYHTGMALAKERGLQSIAFPSISTGIYGYPLNEAAPIAIGAVAQELSGETSVEEAYFVLFDQKTYDFYAAALAEWKAKQLK